MKNKHFTLNTLFMIILLVLLPSLAFAATTTGNDGFGDFKFNSMTQVELEKVNINSYENNNNLNTAYTGELIAFKVGTMTIDYTNYRSTIKQVKIMLTDYQNYVATIQTDENHKSDMGFIARVNVKNSRGSNLAYNEWYVIDDATSSTNGNYVNVGTYSNPEEAIIEFFFIVVDPDSLEENKNLTVKVDHVYNNQSTSGYNPAVFSNYKIGRWWYNNRYIDDATIEITTTALAIDKEYVTHYVLEDSRANIQIVKMFDDNDDFFDGQPHDYYKVIIDSTINSASTTNKFELGLQIVSEHNFKLYLDEDGVLNSSKNIPYELYIKYKDGSGNVLINNSDKYTIKHINSTNNEANKVFYLTTKSEVTNYLTTEEGLYKDYVYLHFITEDYASDYGTEINLN